MKKKEKTPNKKEKPETQKIDSTQMPVTKANCGPEVNKYHLSEAHLYVVSKNIPNPNWTRWNNEPKFLQGIPCHSCHKCLRRTIAHPVLDDSNCKSQNRWERDRDLLRRLQILDPCRRAGLI